MLAVRLAWAMLPITNLKKWRERRGLSQRELALKSGVHHVSIARMELAQLDPQLSTLLKLCTALHITPNQLIGVVRKPRKGGYSYGTHQTKR
jgi:transcriptional regulator with XRE-family HTH domain